MATTSHTQGLGTSLHLLALLQAAQSDDRRAMDELLHRYEPLVRAVVARVRAPYGCDREELAQDARLGLLGAIRAWQPDRGPFGAFAARCARGQVIKALDRAGAHKHQLLSRAISLDSSLAWMAPRDTGEEMFGASLHDRLASPSRLDQPVAMLLAREELDRVSTALPALTARERAALTGVLNGKSHQQLAVEQGSNSNAVKLSLRRARRKLGAEEPLAA
jgi:RNA polymerase sigma factor (sigma-70 family)